MRLGIVLLIFTAQASASCFDIQADDLRVVLGHLAARANVEMLFDMNVVRPYYSNGAHGCMSSIQALEQILDGTPFTYFIYNKVAMLAFIKPCQPELGADAPLPPCLPPSIKIKASL